MVLLFHHVFKHHHQKLNLAQIGEALRSITTDEGSSVKTQLAVVVDDAPFDKTSGGDAVQCPDHERDNAWVVLW